MRLIEALLWLVAAVPVVAIEFPTTIELDVVFPRNETYNSKKALPMVFAIQNAEAAFQFGYTVTWSVTMGSSGQILRSADSPVPPEVIDNIWYEYGNITYYDEEQSIQPGTYNLSTRYIMGSCTDTPTTVNIGVTVLEASVEFTIVDDGSGKDVDLTSECPVFQDTVTVERLTGPVASTASCPVKAESEPVGISNPCRARMGESVANCILNDLTGQYNISNCDQAPPRPADEDDNLTGGTNTSTPTAPNPEGTTTPTGTATSATGSGTAQTGTANSAGIREYSPTICAAVLMSFAVVVSVW